jgi:NAD(P)-dependent dehydrogenase (short-subunit alcohol dehydrogenase family)
LGDEAGAARAAHASPMGRLGRPEDIAATVIYLAGRGGAYTSGAIVPVDGAAAAFAPPSLFGQHD